MSDIEEKNNDNKSKSASPVLKPGGVRLHMPAIRAPEKASHIYRITLYAPLLPLAGGIVIFGWRAAFVALLSMVTCALIERVYFSVMKSPSLAGRSHALLTGLLLALTLPPFTPWYVVVMGAS